MAGINKEIWLKELKENFIPEDNFLIEPRDLSALVTNDKIHLAEAGAKPVVIEGPISYPLSVNSRTDTPIEKALLEYATGVTRVGHVETVERVYDKMKSVMYGHKQALREKIAKQAAYDYAPTTNSTKTPILKTTGGANNEGNKRLTFDDVLKLRTAFNRDNVPGTGRVLVLTPDHEADLITEDRGLYKTVMSAGSLYGFKVYTYNELPYFNRTNANKLVANAIPTAEDFRASISFHKDEVIKAIGTTKMFFEGSNPEYQADTVSFYMRALTAPVRNRAIGVIYSQKHV